VISAANLNSLKILVTPPALLISAETITGRRPSMPCSQRSPDSTRIDMLTFDRTLGIVMSTINRTRMPPPTEIPYGTLDLMVLKTLEQMGPLHGYGIARRIEQIAEGMLALNQGTIYPALLRLQQRGWITSAWGSSENNRKARFYSITRSGKKQLVTERENWARTVAMMHRMLGEG
jgi:transcriptional regulator